MEAAAGSNASSASKSKRPEFVTQRVFDAPRRLLWEAWSKAEHLSKWLPPNGMSMASCTWPGRPC